MYTERRSREEAGVVSQHDTVGVETHSEKREYQKILRVWGNKLRNMKQLSFVVGVVVLMLNISGCRTLGPETLIPKVKNEKLLPSLTPVFDYESFYTVFPMSTMVGVVSSGGVMSGSTSKNPVLEGFNTIFQRDVRGNVCKFDPNELDEKTNGKMRCSLVEASGKVRIWWAIPSGLTIFVANLFGMPLMSESHKLQIEVNIYDRNDKRVGRYTSDLHKDKAYTALYYGYNNPTQKCNRLIFTQCMEDIKQQIAKDYDRLNEALK